MPKYSRAHVQRRRLRPGASGKGDGNDCNYNAHSEILQNLLRCYLEEHGTGQPLGKFTLLKARSCKVVRQWTGHLGLSGQLPFQTF